MYETFFVLTSEIYQFKFLYPFELFLEYRVLSSIYLINTYNIRKIGK